MNDFLNDIRFHDSRDSEDRPLGDGIVALVEFSECNKNALLEAFLKVKDTAKAILEIGVCRNEGESSTYVFLNNKHDHTKYLGLDLEDKTFLDSKEKNIYTMKVNSSNYIEIRNKSLQLGIFSYDFILIDGFHSINQCIDDWKFVKNLATGGIVALHDTTRHPGPVAIVENINTDIWNVERLCLEDNGITILRKKI